MRSSLVTIVLAVSMSFAGSLFAQGGPNPVRGLFVLAKHKDFQYTGFNCSGWTGAGGSVFRGYKTTSYCPQGYLALSATVNCAGGANSWTVRTAEGQGYTAECCINSVIANPAPSLELACVKPQALIDL